MGYSIRRKLSMMGVVVCGNAELKCMTILLPP